MNVAELRARFPILERRTYLASHSLGAVPRGAREALLEYYELWADRGILAWDGPWWQEVTDFCARVERLLGAEAGTVAPMLNVTRAMAAVASCLDYSRRPKVVMTDLEFTTSYPFWRGQERLGAEIVLVRSDDGVSLPAERLAEAVDERTALVPTSHAYFRSGALQDLRPVVEAAHAVGAMVLGDGYQAVGTVPVDVRALGVDFYVGGCHKWLCGGPGAGFLYVRPDRVRELRPGLTGWFGLREPFGYRPDTGPGEPHPGALRFLDGTPNVPALYAAREGLRTVLEVGLEAIRERSRELTGQILEQADRRGIAVTSPRRFEERNGMVCLDLPKEAVERLAAREVVVDWRPDCGVRVSPHFYNLPEEIDRFFGVLDEGR